MINCCVYGVPPAPVYKGARGGGSRPGRGAPRGSPTPIRSRTPPIPIRTRGEGRAASPCLLSSLPPRPTKDHLIPGGFRSPPGTTLKSRFYLEHFRYPNLGFQYINLHVSTISRLVVMSVITSETPNYLQYIKTYKLII